MKKKGYYSSGEFMKLSHITKKTIRYYDEHNILKPSFVDEKGARFYTDDDLLKIQQILLFKYLGFSLSDIKEMTINLSDKRFMADSLKLQKKLVEDRIEQLKIVSETLKDTADALNNNQEVNYSQMLELIHHMGMEASLKNQYQNASNISARINLHSLYSANKQGWFPWIYEQYNTLLQKEHFDKDTALKILETGCGDGTFWIENITKLPQNIKIILSDISEGMLRDTRKDIYKIIGNDDERFSFLSFNCEDIPYKDNSFDLVIANHVLFYCNDLEKTCSEIKRVLKPNGVFISSTYGSDHMKEVSLLVHEFDDRITLSANNLFDKFGKENGQKILKKYFSTIEWRQYNDHLIVPDSEPLISYILSCHGNQNQYIPDKFKEFRTFIKKKTEKGLYITKDAGIFICHK